MRRKDHGMKNTGIVLHYPHTSSSRHVCFNCRVCFHTWRSSPGHCVNCGGNVQFAGNAFRAPKKNNVREWAKLELLIRSGTRFTHSGGGGHTKGFTVNEVKEQVRRKVTNSTRGYAAKLPGKGKRVYRPTWQSGYEAPEHYELP